MQKSPIRFLSCSTHKNNLKLLDLSIRPEIIKILRKKYGKNLLNIGAVNNLFGYDIKNTTDKSKNKQVGLCQTKILLYRKISHQ